MNRERERDRDRDRTRREKEQVEPSEEDLLNIRTSLRNKREEILSRILRLQSAMRELSAAQVEFVEEAQETHASERYEQLDQHGQKLMKEIDLALYKIAAGSYGICEACGNFVNLKRLYAIPWTRLCVEDASEFEKKRRALPPPEEVSLAELPPEYRGFTNRQIERAIRDRILSGGLLDQEDLGIRVRAGVVELEGSLLTEAQHQTVIQLLSDVMGFKYIEDRVNVRPSTRGEERIAPAAEQI